MRHSILFAVLGSSLLLGGCVWVKMDPQARGVQVASASQDLSGCQRRGEVAVAVKDGVAFVSRNQLKVRDELETLARNEAVGLNADTIQAKAEPADGQQRFLAFSCGAAATPAAPARQPAEPVDDGEVEVFRIE